MPGLPTPPSRVDQVYDAIVEEICSGELTGGDSLRQEVLAEKFQISRQPIQQALLLLKSHGLVREGSNRRGLEVVPLDEKFLTDLYEVRGVIDGLAARLATENSTETDLKAIESHLRAGDVAVESKSFSQMIEADMAFHQEVHRVSDNGVLLENFPALFHNVRRVMGEILRRSGTPQWVWDEHQAIYEAIAAGDSALAEKLARDHAVHGTDLVVGQMKENQRDTA